MGDNGTLTTGVSTLATTLASTLVSNISSSGGTNTTDGPIDTYGYVDFLYNPWSKVIAGLCTFLAIGIYFVNYYIKLTHTFRMYMPNISTYQVLHDTERTVLDYPCFVYCSHIFHLQLAEVD